MRSAAGSSCGSVSPSARGSRVPVAVAHPYQLSLTQASEAILAKQLSPVELLESCLARAQALEPQLTAWALLTPEVAMAAAREAERAPAREHRVLPQPRLPLDPWRRRREAERRRGRGDQRRLRTLDQLPPVHLQQAQQ